MFTDERGCSYCGGLGHRITDCPKLEAMQNKQASNIGRRDYLANNSADWWSASDNFFKLHHLYIVYIAI